MQTGDLQNYLNINGKIEIYKGINWFNQLVLGLKYLHENKCIHGDVKPSNILIKKDVLKISNFGVSKLIKSLNLMVSKDIETIEKVTLRIAYHDALLRVPFEDWYEATFKTETK